MQTFTKTIEKISDFIWGYPMILLLLFCGIFFTFQLKFLPFRHAKTVLQETVGKLFSKQKTGKSGTLSPFQAFTTSLASTAGATNVVGVPVAIGFGGPGALFWMWVVALIGMSLIYAEIVLGIKFREKNEKDEWVGGPVYYMQKGLHWKIPSVIYATGLLFEVFASSMVQANCFSKIVTTSFGWSKLMVGIGLAILVAIMVFGGVQRIGKVTEKLLPFLVLVYIGLTGYIIFTLRDQIPETFGLIFQHAFTKTAPIGLFAGASIIETIRWGMARGLYTSDAGMGNSAIANATAEVEYPSQQGFWGIFAVFIDTIVICSLSGLVVLLSGEWQKAHSEEAQAMILQTFSKVFGEFPSQVILSFMIGLFAVATIGVIIYYGEKQAEFLFFPKAGYIARFFYLGAIVLGSIGALEFCWKLVDLVLVFVVVPNVLALMFLYKHVKEETDRFLDYQKTKKRAPKAQT